MIGTRQAWVRMPGRLFRTPGRASATRARTRLKLKRRCHWRGSSHWDNWNCPSSPVSDYSYLPSWYKLPIRTTRAIKKKKKLEFWKCWNHRWSWVGSRGPSFLAENAQQRMSTIRSRRLSVHSSVESRCSRTRKRNKRNRLSICVWPADNRNQLSSASSHHSRSRGYRHEVEHRRGGHRRLEERMNGRRQGQ